MNVLVFGFKDTVAEKVLGNIKYPADKIILSSSEAAINTFINSLESTQYDYILGLGVYNGRDQDFIRIETLCSSQFRNTRKSNKEILNIEPYMAPDAHMKLASGIGNSWCNLTSYLLKKNHTSTSYTFLHIPKSFNVISAAKTIDDQLSSRLVR